MPYVDGYLLAVPDARREDYLRLCALTGPVFRDHGALAHVECWGEDVPDGTLTSFPMAVKREEGESVVFAWVVWPSKEIRDAGMKAFMEDPRITGFPVEDVPFDGKRMVFGGFEVIYEA